MLLCINNNNDNNNNVPNDEKIQISTNGKYKMTKIIR